jgi:hypothetical protein|tara:strand:+ start:3003 stop:3197 length:195 start_codon:yes stop_codon:yes gene_type:complete
MSNQYPFGHPKYGTQGPITEKEYNSINFRNKDINQITQKKMKDYRRKINKDSQNHLSAMSKLKK